MPAKKKAAAAAEPELDDSHARVKASSEGNAKEAAAAAKTLRAEREAEANKRQASFDSTVVRRPKVKADPEGNIDERMQALLEDHQDMGARPK